MKAVPPASEPNSPGLTPQFTAWSTLLRRIWGSPEFLKLWSAQVITQTGEWVMT